MIMFDYFVSYRIPDDFGRCRITRSIPISSIEEIESMEKAITKNQREKGTLKEGDEIFIVNWQKFEKLI